VLDKWLGHRLGLQISPAGEIRLTFGFAAAHVRDARYPTFLDTTWTYLPLWDWRGFTRPLPSTPKTLAGLSEVVAEPPEIGRVNRPVLRVFLPRP
jgi:hypothetical protein